MHSYGLDAHCRREFCKILTGWQLNDHNLSRFCKMCRTETRMLEEWYRAQGAEAAGAQGAEACDKLDGLIRGAEKVSGPTASDAKSK